MLSKYYPDLSLDQDIFNDEFFHEYLVNNGDEKIFELADFMMMTMASPRISHYSDNNFYNI